MAAAQRQADTDRRRLEKGLLQELTRDAAQALRGFIFGDCTGLLSQPDLSRMVVAQATLEQVADYLADIDDPKTGLPEDRRRQEEVISAPLEAPEPLWNPLLRTRALRAAYAEQVQARYDAIREVLLIDILRQICVELRKEVELELSAIGHALDELATGAWKKAGRILEGTFAHGARDADGLAIEVLGDHRGLAFCHSEAKRLEGQGFQGAVAKAMADWLAQAAREALAAVSGAEAPGQARDARSLRRGRAIEAFLREKADQARRHISHVTLWHALVTEAKLSGARGEREVANHIIDRVRDLATLAEPLYNLWDEPLGLELHHVTLFVSLTQGYEALQSELDLPALGQLIASAVGSYSPVNATGPDAPYEAMVMRFEHGVPLGLLTSLTEYRRAYRRVAGSQSTPLLTDRRHLVDPDYALPDPGLGAIEPWRHAFLVAGLRGAVRRDSDGHYSWREPDGVEMRVPSRGEAIAAFREASYVSGTLCRVTLAAWSQRDHEAQLAELRRIEERLVKNLAGETEDGATMKVRHDTGELAVMRDDLRAVREVIQSERYWVNPKVR